MAVRKRGGSWQADITLGGRRYRETFNTEREAVAWELKARAAVASGEPVPCPNGPDKATVGTSEPSRNRGEATLEAVLERTHARFWQGTSSDAKTRVNMRLIAAYFGPATAIADIDTDRIDAFVAHCEAARNSNATINRKLAVLSKALRFAADRKLLTAVPRIERKREAGCRIRWLSSEEEKALIGLLSLWGKDDHAEVVGCLIDTGMRPGELYALTARDVDLKNGTITIWVNKTDLPRTIAMTRRVRAVVERRIGGVTSPTARLFPYDNFWMRYVWDRARSHLGFVNDPHFVPYICRHTCASRLAQRGVHINVIKDWLGHASIVMTMRYAHLAPANLKAAAEVLEGV